MSAKKAGRPIRGASRLVSRAYRLEPATIATIKRMGTDLGLSHAQVVARAVEALAGEPRPTAVELERAHRLGRRESLGEALAAENARQAGEDRLGYLPLDCPQCARRRVTYKLAPAGHVVSVECEKCRWTGEDPS